jgi:hypothetical protein
MAQNVVLKSELHMTVSTARWRRVHLVHQPSCYLCSSSSAVIRAGRVGVVRSKACRANHQCLGATGGRIFCHGMAGGCVLSKVWLYGREAVRQGGVVVFAET